MSLILLGIALLLALLTTLVLGFPLRRLALAHGWVDRPDGHRKLHDRPTATVGGVVIVGGFAVGYAFLVATSSWLPVEWTLPSFGLWVGAIGIVAAGLYDDIRNLTFRQKFVIQIVAALFLVQAGYRLDLSAMPFGDNPLVEVLYSLPISVLWIVGITNAVNLIDGMDGLATGVSYIGLAFFALIFSVQGDAALLLIVLPLIGALAGFLIHNFNRATVFMGDSGSLFLGFMLAAASLHGATHSNPTLSILIPAVVLGVPVLDTFLCILRRTAHGRSVFSPDRDHIHHRLLRANSPRFVVITLYVVAVSFGLVAFLMTLLDARAAFATFGLVLAAIVIGVYSLGYFRSERIERPTRTSRSGGRFTTADRSERVHVTEGDGELESAELESNGVNDRQISAPYYLPRKRRSSSISNRRRPQATHQNGHSDGNGKDRIDSDSTKEAGPASARLRNGKESRAESP